VLRFSCPVFPSEDDHVVTSPYNAVLAAAQLVAHAHCVLPLENQALAAISGRLEEAAATQQQPRQQRGGGGGGSGSGGGRGSSSSSGGADAAASAAAGGSRRGSSSSASSATTTTTTTTSKQQAQQAQQAGRRGWDGMNGLAASLLLHLTASIRFEGSLNTDLNDITMNLVRGCRCVVCGIVCVLVMLGAGLWFCTQAACMHVSQYDALLLWRELSTPHAAHTARPIAPACRCPSRACTSCCPRSRRWQRRAMWACCTRPAALTRWGVRGL
jgi:hypothetical protein